MHDLIHDAEDFGEADEIEVIDALVQVTGLDVLDIGCGDGRITRHLAMRGANALGIEPDPVQAEKNRRAQSIPGLRFTEAPGQNLPIADTTIDGVFFSFSFHHVPQEYMDEALNEAARVLKPETGFLYILEPMMLGSLEDVYRPFHDETEVRTQAYKALTRLIPRFAKMRELHYRETIRYDCFETFVEKIAGSTYSIVPREQVDTPIVKAAFERGRIEDGYAFIQHSRVNLYIGPLC